MTIDRPIAIALILFVVLLLVFFLVVPEYKKFAELQIDLGEKTAEYNAEFEYYNAITKVYEELQSRKDDIKKVDDALPTDPDLGKIIYYVQKTAAENGMVMKDLFLSKSSLVRMQRGGEMKEITFSLDLVGDYASLEKFLIASEKAARLFEVTNISFGSATQTALQSTQSQFEIEQTYNFNMQIKTHSY